MLQVTDREARLSTHMSDGEAGASGAEEFIQSLPPAVQTKVNHLKGLQSKYDDLDTEFQKEVQALEAKYAELYGTVSSLLPVCLQAVG